MNLLIVGKDVDDLALKVWEANTNYTVLNMSPYLWGKDFNKFYKKHKELIDKRIGKRTNGVRDFQTDGILSGRDRNCRKRHGGSGIYLTTERRGWVFSGTGFV